MSAPGTPSRGASLRPMSESVKELTLRGVVIGGIITLVFTAANVYLGLKVGLTFATSIPAAVISMAEKGQARAHVPSPRQPKRHPLAPPATSMASLQSATPL